MKYSLWIPLLICGPLLADVPGPVSTPTTPAPQTGYFGDQLLPIQNADAVVKDFRAKYNAANKPRLLIYINRDLVAQRGEMVDVMNVQDSTQVKGDTVAPNSGLNIQVGTNTNSNNGKSNPSPVVTGQGGEMTDTKSLSVRVLPDANKGVAPITDYDARQIEDVFSDRFSQGGARFIDQKIATALLKPFATVGDRFLTPTADNPEKDELDALKKSADIVIEILARHKTVVIATPAGNASSDRLDLSATAIDLRQSGLILGRVTSDGLFGFNKRDGQIREAQDAVLTSDDFLDQVSLALMDRINF